MSKFCPIVGTLGYVLSEDQKKVLMLHRNSNKEDTHFGKYIGLGGKVDPHEDVAQAMKREIFEESGLEVLKMKLKGTMVWTDFGRYQENWLGFIFLITEYRNKPFSHCREGQLEWVPIEQLSSLPLWEGDYPMLDLIFDDKDELFHGNMSYDGPKMKSFLYTRV